MITAAFIIFAVGGVLYVGFNTYMSTLAKANRKEALVPTVAYPQPGVCQCGDALCYHDVRGCSVANCPCKMFVASTMLKDGHDDEEAKPYRLMLEAAKAVETHYPARRY